MRRNGREFSYGIWPNIAEISEAYATGSIRFAISHLPVSCVLGCFSVLYIHYSFSHFPYNLSTVIVTLAQSASTLHSLNLCSLSFHLSDSFVQHFDLQRNLLTLKGSSEIRSNIF